MSDDAEAHAAARISAMRILTTLLLVLSIAPGCRGTETVRLNEGETLMSGHEQDGCTL